MQLRQLIVSRGDQMQLKSMYVVRIINRIVENGLLVREVFYYARNIGVCTVGSDIYKIKCKDARVANENVAGLRRRQGGVMISALASRSIIRRDTASTEAGLF